MKSITLTYIALIVLALATWGLANVDLGPAWVNNVVALAIAVTKAGLVVMIFMEMRRETKLSRLWAAAGIAWFLIMSTILGDYFTRQWDTRPKSWQQEAGTVAGSPDDGGSPTPTIYNGR